MAIDSNLAGVARVAFEAETGEFNRDVSMAEQRYKKATEGMSDSAIRLELAQNRLHRALAKGPSNYQAIARAELAVRRESSALNRELDEQARKLDRTERSLGRFTRGALVGSGALGRFGRAVSFASGTFLGGAGLAYAFKSTLDLAGDFQRSMNILRAVTGASAEEMTRAGEEAKRLGRDVTLPATSAKDAADSMTTLAKAGLDVTNAIAGSEGVLRLAAAASIDVASAGNIAAKAIAGFGLNADETTRVADVFANAANASIGSIDDYALALSQSATVAKSWGLSIEETVTTLALFAKAGIQGSDAGTSFRVMLSRLKPTTKNAIDAFDELKISAFDSAGQIKPYRDIISQLHDAFVKLTPEAQKYYIQTIFGQDAQRGAGIAILNTIKNYDQMYDKITQVGSAQKFAAAINEGYVGSLDAFKSAVETLQITIGTELLPRFTKALEAATEWVNEMEKDGKATEEVKTAVHDAAVVLGLLKDALVFVKDAIQPVVDTLGGLTRALEFAIGAFLIRKILKSFGILVASSSTAATKGAADAAIFGRAWDIATRPRVMSVTTVGGGGLPGPSPAPGAPTTTSKPAPTRPGTRWTRVGGAIRSVLGPAGAAAVGGLLVYNAVSGTQNQVTGFGEPIAETGDGRLIYRKNGKLYVNAPGPGATDEKITVRGAGGRPITMYAMESGPSPTEIRAPGEGRAPAPAKRPPRRKRPNVPGGAGGDGLTALQRAEIASAEATTPGAELSAERSILSIYERELATTKKTGEELYKLRLKVAQQRNRVRDIEKAIATDAKNDRDERRRNYAERRSAEEQELRNVFDEALQTPGRRDDRRAFIKLRNYLQARVNDKELERDERAKARKRLNALRKEWTKENEKANEAELDAQEKVLQNNVALAELTEKNTKDDLKAHRRLRDFYKKREHDKDLTKEERQEFRGKRLEEQKAINELLKKQDESDAAERRRATAQNLLDEFSRVTREFSSNVMYGVPGGGMGYGTVAPTTGAGGTQVTVVQNFKAPTADRHREARMARMAVGAQFLG